MESSWRGLVGHRCGGTSFDAPDSGYSFSKILADERQLEKFNQRGVTRSALLKLSIADPRWKMPMGAYDAGTVYYVGEPDATRYTDNNGIPETHERIAAVISNSYAAAEMVDNNMVQYSPGSIKRLLAECIPAAFFDQETALMFPTPGYPVIKNEINRRGAQVYDVPLDFKDGKWSLDIEKLDARVKCDYRRKKFVYLNMPHNPTGIDFNHDQWVAILAWASESQVKLIVDEAYTDIRYSKKGCSVLNVPGWENVCLVLQSVSKGWSATGLRFGWVIGDPVAIAAIRKVMDVKDSGGFGPSIASGLYCLEHPLMAKKTRDDYFTLHRCLADVLNGAGFVSEPPAGGLCQLTLAPRSADGVEFADVVECAKWFRETLRVSLMHYNIDRGYLRWSTTVSKVPECGLLDEASVIEELGRRLRSVNFTF